MVRLTLCRKPLLSISQTSDVQLRDLVLENTRGWALRIEDSERLRVENCLVRNTGLGGIYCTGGRDNHILGCEVTRTASRAILQRSSCATSY